MFEALSERLGSALEAGAVPPIEDRDKKVGHAEDTPGPPRGGAEPRMVEEKVVSFERQKGPKRPRSRTVAGVERLGHASCP